MPTFDSNTIAPEQLRRARIVFDAALAEQGARREEVLASADSAVRALVEEMLRADDSEHRLLDSGLAAPLGATGFRKNDLIGSYRVVRELGTGGMGSVYLAECQQPASNQLVAVKVVRWPSPDLSRRFYHEQLILRDIRHPNIARFFDTGITDRNLPYFVMEYVEGEPIDQYCKRYALSLKNRILLFRQLCGPVSYLHRHLIVHRDLKPANILVTESGTVKLLDFGIAKLLNGSTALPAATHTAAGLMTPDYASPEQVKGGAISTLTDVYGLGAVLYDLLAGVRAHSCSAHDLPEALRRICEEEPEKPSVVSANSHTESYRSEVAGELRGELDNIVLMALRKEPERRYVSVEQFDEDLRRYLAGLPVLAQGDSFAYRARKYVLRNKTVVGATAVSLSLLLGGVITTSIAANIARAERNRAEYQAREAERQKALAEQQTQIALQERVRAEHESAQARIERANAERRLSQLKKLASGAVEAYTQTQKPEANAGQNGLVEHALEALLTLRNEKALPPEQTAVLDATYATRESYKLATDSSWHVPPGWIGRETVPHEYRIGVDHTIVHKGRASLFLKSLTSKPKGTALVSQTFAAERFNGKRVRLSAFLRPEKVDTQGTLALFATDEDGYVQTYDSVGISATAPWKRYQIVIDVPAEACFVHISLEMTGSGTLWADSLAFETVNGPVPLTQPIRPKNLDFKQR